MNIFFLSTWYPYPPDNGSKLRAYHMIRALSRDHHVTVVAFQPERIEKRAVTQDVLFDDVPVWGVPEDPFRYVNLPQVAKYLSPIPLSSWPSRAMRRAASNVITGRHWDAVVAFQMPVARYAFLPQCTVRVFDLDNSLSFMTDERMAAQGAALSRLKARISLLKSLRYECRLARRFDVCTVVSPVEVDFIHQMVNGQPCRVEVSGNGVDCSHNRPGFSTPRRSSLVYNGALTYSANYDAMRWFLAQIYPRVQAWVPDVSLSITGSTGGVNLSSLALDNSVILTGYVDEVRIPVAASSVCVVPIRQGGGTRLKILEAMALGTPVVATSKGAEGLDVVDGTHLLLADEPETFANCTVELLNNPDLRQRLATNARRLVEERYDWQAIGARYVDLVEATVRERRERTG